MLRARDQVALYPRSVAVPRRASRSCAARLACASQNRRDTSSAHPGDAHGWSGRCGIRRLPAVDSARSAFLRCACTRTGRMIGAHPEAARPRGSRTTRPIWDSDSRRCSTSSTWCSSVQTLQNLWRRSGASVLRGASGNTSGAYPRCRDSYCQADSTDCLSCTNRSAHHHPTAWMLLVPLFRAGPWAYRRLPISTDLSNHDRMNLGKPRSVGALWGFATIQASAFLISSSK